MKIQSFNTVIFLLAIVMAIQSCHVVRAVTYLAPDPADKDHMPKAIISKSPEPFRFAEKENGLSKAKKDFILQHLKRSNTDAFIVIQHDSILYEYYSRRHDKTSLFLGFSLSKSFVATLLGIAIDEGYIKGTSDRIISYIPEFKSADTSLQNVSIQQLLDMRSGIEIDEYTIDINGPLTRMYYGSSINKELFKLHAAKGARFEYKNVNTQLLSLIIERATGKKFLDYFRDKLWHRIGAEYDAQWIIDDHGNQTAKAFFGLIASARDYAKLGRLYISNGEMKQQQVVSSKWIDQCCNLDTLLKYNYKNHWWANNDDHFFSSDSLARHYLQSQNQEGLVHCPSKDKYCVSLKGNSFIAEGMLDQYIYVNPSKGLIIVRLGGAVPESALEMDQVITRLGNVF